MMQFILKLFLNSLSHSYFYHPGVNPTANKSSCGLDILPKQTGKIPVPQENLFSQKQTGKVPISHWTDWIYVAL